MTQTTSAVPSSNPMGQNDLTVLSPEEIKVFNDAREAKNLVSWVHKEYEKARNARQKFERQWALNMAMYTGKQNMTYFPAAPSKPGYGLLTNPPALPHVSRKVFNRIRPIIRTEYARITSNKPNASVVPASSEDADLFAAQAAEQIWESMYNAYKLHKIFGTSAFWLTICGTAFTKVWWDPDCEDPLTQIPGTIKSGAVTPYHIFVPDLYSPDIEDQPFVINVYTKSREWVKKTYGIDVNPTVTSARSPFDTMVAVIGKNDAEPDSVLLYEMWLKPAAHALFPEGGLLTIVNDQIVQISQDGLPYEHNEFPFIKWDHIPTGLFYSDSVITDLIDPQREYNRTRNQLIEAKNRMAKPQLIAPKGSVDAKKMTTQPGQLIEYRPGMAPPQPLPLQPMPNYVMNELDRTIIDMEDISSQHQISRGQAPPGVTAATAISFMQERDDSLLTSVFQSVEQGWEKWAKQSISHVVQFWDAPRTISVTGVDGSFDSIALIGSEVGAGKDIRMEAGSALPTSKAAKQALLMDMMKMGFIDPQKGLSLMDMGGMDQLYNELKVDERQAQRENLRMARLDINQIMEHEQNAQMSNEFAAMQQAMMQPPAPPMGGMGAPNMADEGMPNEGMPSDSDFSMEGQEPPPTGGVIPPPAPAMGMGAPMGAPPAPGPGGVDPNSQAPLQIPMNIVSVNTYDNHQVHIDVHNRYRKSQAFELLPPEIKQQFEYHVAAHAMALNSAAQAAMMLPPPPGGGEMSGATNGSGTPIGTPPAGPPDANQFGPPGTSDGNPPPPVQ